MSSVVSLSSGGIPVNAQSVQKGGSGRQVQKDVADIGKALQAGDVNAAQSAVTALKNAAPTQDGGTDLQNAVKALDQAVKSGDLKSARDAFANVQQNQQSTRRAPQAPAASAASNAAAPTVGGLQVKERSDTSRTEVLQQTQAAATKTHESEQTLDQAFITRHQLTAGGGAKTAKPGSTIDITA